LPVDRDPVWWEGFYREDEVDKAGRVTRRRKSVTLGLLKDIPTEAQAKRQPNRRLLERKLLKILEARVGIEPTHKGFADPD